MSTPRRGPRHAAITDLIERASAARAQVIALVLALAATEAGMSTQSWRSTKEHRYVNALAAWGYALSEVESPIVAERP